MHQPRRLRLTASIMLCFVLQALGADKYTDENRPYEFGFKIDGQQHRHESKDTDGIIMGEFGFVTADDVYHVTVYATDKEGRFKILSMKNIHLKSSSTSSLGAPTSARQGHALALPPAQGALAPQPGETSKPVSIEPPGRSCSSCSLPTTTTRAPPPAYNQVPDNNNYNGPNQFGAPGSSPQNQQGFPPLSAGQLNIAQGGPSGSSYSPQGGHRNYPSGQENILKQGLAAPGGVPSFALQSGHTAQNILEQGLAAPGGSPSFAPQHGQTAQNILGQGLAAPGGAPSFAPQPGQTAQNILGQGLAAPGGAPSFAPQPGQTAQNILGQGLAAPGGAPSFAPQPGQTAQNILGQGLAAPGGAPSFAPQHGQTAQNFLEQGPAAQGGAPAFTPQHGHTAQNYPGSQSYVQGPASPNAPNNNAPGVATVPDSINYGQNNIQKAGLSGPNSQPSGQSFYPQGGAGDRTAKQYNGPQQQFDSNLGPQGPGAAQGGLRGPNKPTLFSAQMQIVDKNTDVYALGPNEQKGLPSGLTQGDMTQLLYTFNYTLGFHGHFEEGYTNGVKQGYYFVTGRNGVRTRIDYVADDTGFHPKVSQDVLDLLSEDVPKAETEKDEKYGLKGYEFKWLYYPVESKKR